MAKIISLVLLGTFLGILTIPNVSFSQVRCESLFQPSPKKAQRQFSEQSYLQKYIKSLFKHPSVQNRQHPRIAAKTDMNKLALLLRALEAEFPPLKVANQLVHKVLHQNYKLSPEEYVKIRNTILTASLTTIRSRSGSYLRIYAMIDAIRELQTLRSHVRSKEEDNKNEQENDDKKEQDEQQKKEEQKKQQQEKKQLLEKEKDEYEFNNKDLQSNDADQTPQYAIFTQGPTPLSVLRSSFFEVFGGDLGRKFRKDFSAREELIPAQLPNVSNLKSTNHTLLINEQNATRLVIPMDYGLMPILGTYGKYRIVQSAPQEYAVEALQGTLPVEIIIPKAPLHTQPLSDRQYQLNTIKSGIDSSLWPDHIHTGVNLAKSEARGNMQLAMEHLSKWFQVDGPYLYSAKSKNHEKEFNNALSTINNSTTDVVLKLAETKMYNCDGASLLAATLIRDFFGLPTRIALGLTIKGAMEKDNHKYNVVDLNDPRHAWVEVYINGKWVNFDFTPLKNSPEGEGKKSDLEQTMDDREKNQLDEKNKDQKEQKNQEPKDDQKNKQQENQNPKKESGKEEKKYNWADSSKRTQEQGDSKKSKEVSDEKSKEKPKESKDIPDDKSNEKTNAPDKQSDKQHITKIDRNQSKKDYLDVAKNFNTATGIAIYEILVDAINTLLHTHTREKALELFESKTKVFQEETAEQFKVRAMHLLKNISDTFYLEYNKPITQILSEAKTLIYNNPTEAYMKLQHVLNFLVQLEKIRPLTESEFDLKNNLKTIMTEMQQSRHASSSEHHLVDGLIRNLPGQVIKSIIDQQYPRARELGSPDQLRFTKDILSKKWASAMRALMINKYFNFFLNAEKEYRKRQVKTLIRTNQISRSNFDTVVAQIKDIARIDRWYLDRLTPDKDPVQSLLSNLSRDEQYMRGNVEMVDVATGRDPIEKKHTNIFFDISGSMDGDKAVLQASAIAAIVDRALSEKDSFGRPLHSVVLFPFGENVKRGVHIQDAETARSVVLQLLSSPTLANDGTQFQPCFDKHFEMIQKYYRESLESTKKSGLKLKKTSMILITDGGASVDVHKVQQDIKALPEGVSTFFNLVTLGGKNEDLEQIVAMTNSQRSKSMVTEITEKMMTDFISKSHDVHLNPDAFAMEKNKTLPSHIIAKILGLEMSDKEISMNLAEYEQLKSKIRGVIENKQPAFKLTTDLGTLTKVFSNSDIPHMTKKIILYRILKNYKALSGTELDAVSLLEEQYLLNLINIVEK